MLTSELVRKTRMESEQVAAQAIQQTLQPDPAETIAGYAIEVCTRPFRNVGGDYLDFVTLPDGRAILAVADVSGKGMAAALLSANLQALVRTLATMVPDPLDLTMRINEHLWRYTPDDRYVTAVFIVLTPSTGEITYVNAGHNPPIIWCDGTLTRLDPSGVPLGMFRRSAYESRDARIPPGGSLLLFTDGLTDSIRSDDPDRRLCDLFRAGSVRSMADIQALTDATMTQDDLTIMRSGSLRRLPYRVSCATPTISYGSWMRCPVNLTSRPIGLTSPKYNLAAARFRIATRVEVARSRSVNARPSISRMPNVSK